MLPINQWTLPQDLIFFLKDRDAQPCYREKKTLQRTQKNAQTIDAECNNCWTCAPLKDATLTIKKLISDQAILVQNTYNFLSEIYTIHGSHSERQEVLQWEVMCNVHPVKKGGGKESEFRKKNLPQQPFKM